MYCQQISEFGVLAHFAGRKKTKKRERRKKEGKQEREGGREGEEGREGKKEERNGGGERKEKNPSLSNQDFISITPLKLLPAIHP